MIFNGYKHGLNISTIGYRNKTTIIYKFIT